MSSRIVIGMGTGRCGTHTLAQLLNSQPNCTATHEAAPLLPWAHQNRDFVISERFRRMRNKSANDVLGDVASFYLPYVAAAIAAEPEIRVICLKRDRREVVESFCKWIDKVHPLPTNHWSKKLEKGWYREPLWSTIFPRYDISGREEAVGQYWDEYYREVERLIEQYPAQIAVFETERVLNEESTQREMLSFAGFDEEQHSYRIGERSNKSQTQPTTKRRTNKANDPARCVVLVPVGSHVVPKCEQGLKELERRGYEVRRIRGYAAIDQGRNQMATDALRQGFEETLWIDSDIGFHPNAVDKLRAHSLPIVCGIYPKKGKRELACHIIPGTKQMTFGNGGGLHEIRYAPTGFLHVRREVYEQVQEQLELPVCNQNFGRPMIPFFEPMIHQLYDGHWYLAEDFAFSERARQCGFNIMADTSIRLWHVGMYEYGWEDAGLERDRFGTFHYHFND